MESWIRINNYHYNITDFIKKHPGGSVITYYINQDATDVFNEMHFRSMKKVEKYLKSLPKKPITESDDKTDTEIMKFRELRQKLIDLGYFEPSYIHVLYRLFEVLMIFILATYLLAIGYTFLSILVYGLFGSRCGWILHECIHNSFTGIRLLDNVIGSVFCGFIGLTNSKWKQEHNKHHSATQKIKHDPDLDTMPFVGFFNNCAKEYNRKYNKLWSLCQALTFLPITSGILVGLFWTYYLHPRKIVKERKIFEGLCLLLSHILRPCIIYCYSSYNVYESYIIFLLCQYMTGIYLLGHFSLSHTFCPVVESNENKNWIRYAFDHTVDISTDNVIVSWLMGYLNCQVVHHLFPQMPQFRQPEVSKMLVSFAKDNNINYRIVGYFEAWKLMFRNLNDVGYHLSKTK